MLLIRQLYLLRLLLVVNQNHTQFELVSQKPYKRAGLPDSIVVPSGDDRLLTRARAVLHVMRRLGGVWRVLAGIASPIPMIVLDRVYDVVAAVRHRLFARPSQACPVLPAHLRDRFDS